MFKSFTLSAKFKAIDEMTAPINKMQLKTRALYQNLEGVQRTVKSAKNGIGGQWIERGLLAGALGLGFAFKKATDEAGKFQAVSVSFIPPFKAFGKSAEDAAKFTSWLDKEAIATAYTFEGLADAGKRLFANLGGDTERTMKTMKMFEDAAGGNTDKLDRISAGYSKGLLMGKFNLLSLNMIAKAGVPIFRELAKVMFGSVDATKKVLAASKKGEIGLDDVEKAFENMTSAGGVFFGSAGLYATTWAGQMDIIGESINSVWRTLGFALIPALQDLYPMMITVIDSTKAWLIANKGLIKSGFKKFVLGVVDAFKWIYNNWDGIVTGLKIWIGAWAALTVVNVGLNLVITALKVIDLLMLPFAPAVVLIGIAVYGLAKIWGEVGNNIDEATEHTKRYGKVFDESFAKNKLIADQGFSIWEQSFDNVLNVITVIFKLLARIPGLTGTVFGSMVEDIERYRAGLQAASSKRTELTDKYGLSPLYEYERVNNNNPIQSMKVLGNSSRSGNTIPYGVGAKFSPFREPGQAQNVDAAIKRFEANARIELSITTPQGTQANVLNNTIAKAINVTLNNNSVPTHYFQK
jgi:hypothetical protein